MWKTIFDSVRGTSHERTATPCQDSSAVRVVDVKGQTYLLASCADGAGTAEYSNVGSRIAVDYLVELAAVTLAGGSLLQTIDRTQALGWYQEVRSRIDNEASARQTESRQLACTLLLAIVGQEGSVFVQVGDGAIVIGCNDAYETVFWPQSGEYANTTNFLTDAAYKERAVFAYRHGIVEELAVFTDGLQMLGLSFAQKKVHAPFFLPLFRSLRNSDDPAALQTPLRTFLESGGVNDRTDDDKTLILATRYAHHAGQDPL